MELRALLAGFMTAVVLTACQSSSPTISDDRLGRFFRDLMYGEDFALNRKNDRLLRWKGPIKVGISDDYTPDEKTEIEVRMRLVSRMLSPLLLRQLDRQHPRGHGPHPNLPRRRGVRGQPALRFRLAIPLVKPASPTFDNNSDCADHSSCRKRKVWVWNCVHCLRVS